MHVFLLLLWEERSITKHALKNQINHQGKFSRKTKTPIKCNYGLQSATIPECIARVYDRAWRWIVKKRGAATTTTKKKHTKFQRQTNIQFNYLLDAWHFRFQSFVFCCCCCCIHQEHILCKFFNGITRESINESKQNNNTNYSVVIISISACCSFQIFSICSASPPSLFLSISSIHLSVCIVLHSSSNNNKIPFCFSFLFSDWLFEMFKWINLYKANK